MSLICFCTGIICLAYYLLIVVYAGITADFAWFWALLAVLFEGCAVFIRYGRNHPGFFGEWLKYGIGTVVLAGTICFAFICSQVISGMKASGEKNLDYVVVLGAHVKGDVPSKALELRLKAALKYARENEDTILILSGGQGSGESIQRNPSRIFGFRACSALGASRFLSRCKRIRETRTALPALPAAFSPRARLHAGKTGPVNRRFPPREDDRRIRFWGRAGVPFRAWRGC